MQFIIDVLNMSIRMLIRVGTFADIFTMLTVMQSLPEEAELGRLLMALIVSAAVIVLKIGLTSEEQLENSDLYGEDADWNLHFKLLIISMK